VGAVTALRRVRGARAELLPGGEPRSPCPPRAAMRRWRRGAGLLATRGRAGLRRGTVQDEWRRPNWHHRPKGAMLSARTLASMAASADGMSQGEVLLAPL
jgi:hypothetical protein